MLNKNKNVKDRLLKIGSIYDYIFLSNLKIKGWILIFSLCFQAGIFVSHKIFSQSNNQLLIIKCGSKGEKKSATKILVFQRVDSYVLSVLLNPQHKVLPVL